MQEAPKPKASVRGQAAKENVTEPDIEDFKGEDDLPDDNDPTQPTPRLDIDPGPGLGPRKGFVYEGWRDAIDVVLDDDDLDMRQAADDEILSIREVREGDADWSRAVENKDTGERVFADQLALDKCVHVLGCAVLCCAV